MDRNKSKGVVVDLVAVTVENQTEAGDERVGLQRADRLKRLLWRRRKVELREQNAHAAAPLAVPAK